MPSPPAPEPATRPASPPTAPPAGAGSPARGLAETGPGRATLAAVFGLTLVAYLLLTILTLRYVEPPTGDQPHYLLQTISLVEDGDLDLKNNYTTAASYGQFSAPGRRREGFRGITVAYHLDPAGHVVVQGAGDAEAWYPKHGVGLPVLVIPGWMIGNALAPALLPLTADGGAGWPGAVLQMNVVGALLAVQIFLLAWDLAGSRRIAWAVTLALAGAVPLALLATMLFVETPGALALTYAFRHLMRLRLPTSGRRLALVGGAIGVLPWLNPRFILLAGCLGLLAAAAAWRQPRADRQAAAGRAPSRGVSGPDGANGASSAWAALGRLSALPLLSGVAFVWYQVTHFGSATGATDQYEGFFVPALEGGQLAADWFALLLATLGVLLDRQYGLLIYLPVAALAVVGLVALWRAPAQRPIACALAVVVVPYVALTADFRVWWGGWTPPARYLAVMVPLLAAPLAASLAALRSVRWYGGLFALLVGIGVVLLAAFVGHLGHPEIPQGIFTNPTRNPPLWRWIAAQTGADLTRVLPAIAPWFGNRALPVPWTEIVATVLALALPAILATGALVRRSPTGPTTGRR